MYSLNCFISQPMKNKTIEQIKNEREEVIEFLHRNDMNEINSIIENTSVEDVVCGGDIISAYGGDYEILRDEKTYKKCFGFAKPYYVRGNHDCYAKSVESATTGIIKDNSEVINRFIRPYHSDIVTEVGKTYYYYYLDT